MKIRQGFVSNSSSSSFIVVFPHKPKDAEDTAKMLFGTLDGGMRSEYDSETAMSNYEIGKDILGRVKNKKSLTVKEVAERLTIRYSYSSFNHKFYGGKEYFGTDIKTMEKLKAIEEEAISKSDKMKDGLEKILSANRLGVENSPQFACKGYKDIEDKPYTNKQIKAYEKFNKERQEFTKTNTEYVALYKEKLNTYCNNIEECNKLRLKAAMADAEKFIADNKGAFITGFNIGDEEGSQGAMLEYGNTFGRMKHIVIRGH